MSKQRLTKRIVDAAQPCKKDVYVWDSDLKGFDLKVTPKGRKVYIAQYLIGKRSRRLTIGVHGTLTTEEARQRAKVSLGQVSSGIDPAHERDMAKTGHNIEDLFKLFESSVQSLFYVPV